MSLNLTLIGQMGTFLIFWWFVHTYVWPLFSKIAQERRTKIAEGLSIADKARSSIADAEERSKSMINDAKTQAADILLRANKQADQLVSQAREEARHAGSVEIERAREEIELEKRKAREQLRSQLSSLVVEGVHKIIVREIKTEDHAQLLKELSEKI